MSAAKVFVTGGAGFIGSSVVRRLLDSQYSVTVYDNLSSGTPSNLPRSRNMRIIRGDVNHFNAISSALRGQIRDSSCCTTLHPYLLSTSKGGSQDKHVGKSEFLRGR